MALKRKIDKATFDKLADNIKFEYVADGDNYVLQTEGDEDTGALKRANLRLKDQLEAEERRADAAIEKLEKIEKNPARKQGDIDALERQFNKDKEEAVNAVQTKLDKANSFIKKTLLETTASTIAEKISTAPAIIRPHIERRLTVDIDGDEPSIKVVDASGKATNLTPDKLGEEFVANKEFSSIIRVTKASGGAGPQVPNGGAVKQPNPQGNGNDDNTAFNLSKATPQELAAHVKAKKAAEQNPDQ